MAKRLLALFLATLMAIGVFGIGSSAAQDEPAFAQRLDVEASTLPELAQQFNIEMASPHFGGAFTPAQWEEFANLLLLDHLSRIALTRSNTAFRLGRSATSFLIAVQATTTLEEAISLAERYFLPRAMRLGRNAANLFMTEVAVEMAWIAGSITTNQANAAFNALSRSVTDGSDILNNLLFGGAPRAHEFSRASRQIGREVTRANGVLDDHNVPLPGYTFSVSWLRDHAWLIIGIVAAVLAAAAAIVVLWQPVIVPLFA
ncbi:MAG: hypothetical protein FWB76_04050 [Oscillospiraceae bacterium]|nr:hypothetical protein [Oscillospiraceae bacterium]